MSRSFSLLEYGPHWAGPVVGGKRAKDRNRSRDDEFHPVSTDFLGVSGSQLTPVIVTALGPDEIASHVAS
jgi:hypothetical protein